MSSRVHACEHTVRVAAPAGVVYGMLADAARWPVFLPSVVHVERLDFDGVQERLRMWELADETGAGNPDNTGNTDNAGAGVGGVLGGRVGSWYARRVLHPDVRAVVF
ncbi:hypothetical protein ACFXDI_53990, partial [Streptomyces mirabilis]